MGSIKAGAALVAIAVMAVAPASAQAAFPGANGKIAFVRSGDIWSMNPDGSNQVNVTNTPSATEKSPAWSADGAQIVYVRDGTRTGPHGDPYTEIWVMNADGSGQRKVVETPYDPNVCGSGALLFARYFAAPAWSADSSKIVFQDHRTCWYDTEFSDDTLYTINPDGTGQTQVTPVDGFGARWSPDGTKVGYSGECGGGGCSNLEWITADGSQRFYVYDSGVSADYFYDWSPDGSLMAGCGEGPQRPQSAGCYTVHPDGSGITDLSRNVSPEAWSPDGTKYVWGSPDVYTGNVDGTAVTKIATNGTQPDWQPIVLNYARPKGATPFLTYLVPASDACTAPNRAHGSPLAFGSCAPPTQSSAHLTVGTPDANGHPAGTIGSVRYRTVVGNPSTPANEADLKIDVSITGVLNKSDLTPYGGELSADAGLRITDRSNTPNPGGPGPGTVEDTSFPVTVPCAGGTCSVSTTANAIAPGAVLEGRRAVWQLGQVKVYDGGADGLASTTGDNTLFMVEGVFVP